MSSPAPVLVRSRPRSYWPGRERVGSSLIGRNPALRRMLAASFISTCGDRLHQVALAALVLGLTDSMASAALVFVVSMLPYVLFGLPIGALVDRWDRRKTLISADLVRGVLVAAIPLAATISLPLVYVLLFVVTCATIVFNPTREAAVPDLVETDALEAANSLFQAVNYMVDLLALPLAGVLIAVLIERLGVVRGTSVGFGLDALSYALSAALLRGLVLTGFHGDLRVAMGALTGSAGKANAPRPLAGLPREVLVGLRFLLSDATVRTNTILLTLGPLLLGSLHTLWIGFAWRVSNTGTFGYAVTEAATAVGTLVGLWLLPRALRWLNPGRVILVGFATMGAGIGAAGLSDSLLVVACLALVGGLGNMLFLVPSISLVQRRTPTDLLGRVFGVRLMLTYAAFSLSNAVAGGASDWLGVSPLLLGLGGGMVMLALVGSLVPSAREAA